MNVRWLLAYPFSWLLVTLLINMRIAQLAVPTVMLSQGLWHLRKKEITNAAQELGKWTRKRCEDRNARMLVIFAVGAIVFVWWVHTLATDTELQPVLPNLVSSIVAPLAVTVIVIVCLLRPHLETLLDRPTPSEDPIAEPEESGDIWGTYFARKEAWMHLANVNNSVNRCQNVLWIIFSGFTAANMFLLSTLADLANGEHPEMKLGLATLACFMSFVWFCAQRASIVSLARDEEALRRLQGVLVPHKVMVSILAEEHGDKHFTSTLIRPLLRLVPIVFLVVWALVAVIQLHVSIHRLLKPKALDAQFADGVGQVGRPLGRVAGGAVGLGQRGLDPDPAAEARPPLGQVRQRLDVEILASGPKHQVRQNPPGFTPPNWPKYSSTMNCSKSRWAATRVTRLSHCG